MKQAIFVKKAEGFRGNAALYKLNPPLQDVDPLDNVVSTVEFVIVSTSSFFGVETYIFPASENGEVLDWLELEGSERGVDSHARVLDNIGYEIVRAALPEN